MNLGIDPTSRTAIAVILNELLANEYLLTTKTKNYHWNVEGNRFIELHNLYQTQYTQLDLIVDEIAERIRAIGHYADGSLVKFAKKATIEDEENNPDAQTQLNNLIKDHHSLIRLIRPDIQTIIENHNDVVSADLLTKTLNIHEKMTWMLTSLSKTN